MKTTYIYSPQLQAANRQLLALRAQLAAQKKDDRATTKAAKNGRLQAQGGAA